MKNLFTTKIKPIVLEGVGLLLILFAFGWQSLEEHSLQVKTDSYIYNINKKLDMLWGIEYQKERPDKLYANIDLYQESWKFFQDQKKELKGVDNQITVSWILRILCYVLGSVFVLLPKLWSKCPIFKRE